MLEGCFNNKLVAEIELSLCFIKIYFTSSKILADKENVVSKIFETNNKEDFLENMEDQSLKIPEFKNYILKRASKMNLKISKTREQNEKF